MRKVRWVPVLLAGLILLGCARGGRSSLAIAYRPAQEFSSLREKIGPTVAMAPFRDERPESDYIGFYAPLLGRATQFKSDPILERALWDSISRVLSVYGITTVAVPDWDGEPSSLSKLEGDSALMVEIKKFWIDGKGSLFGADLRSSVRLTIHLGVKKEERAFTRNVVSEKEMTTPALNEEKVEAWVNEVLTSTFDSFFANPY
jgi:hypothetical protein